MVRNNRGGVFLKVLIWFEMVFIILFTVFNLFMFWHKGLEPSTLIMSVYGLFTGNFLAQAYIRGTKTKTTRREEECNEQD